MAQRQRDRPALAAGLARRENVLASKDFTVFCRPFSTRGDQVSRHMPNFPQDHAPRL
jgi:hypothetical protein